MCRQSSSPTCCVEACSQRVVTKRSFATFILPARREHLKNFSSSRHGSQSRFGDLRLVRKLIVLLSLILPVTAHAWWHDEWSFRKEITLDLSAAGANIAGSPADVPVLIRLHLGNFGYFGDTQPDGADLRFVARRRQDAAQVSRRALRPDQQAGLRLGQGAAARGRHGNRKDLSLLRQQESAGRRRRSGHLRCQPGAGAITSAARVAAGRDCVCEQCERSDGRDESRVADRCRHCA